MRNDESKQGIRAERSTLPHDVMVTSEAAKELGVSTATLRRWVSEGRIHGVKVGKQWRFRREDLRAAIRVQEPESLHAPQVEPNMLGQYEKKLDGFLLKRGLKKSALDSEVHRILSEGAAEMDGADHER